MSTIVVNAVVLAVLAIGCGERSPQPITVSERARMLHARTAVANLHSDFAMFHRDSTRASRDRVSDFPRMREAGVVLLGASVVPRVVGGEIVSRLAFWWWGWPAGSRSSPLTRALAQIELMDRFVALDPALRVIRYRDDLTDVREHRALGLLMTMEGGQALVDDVTLVRRFYARGVRVIELTHASNNELGGSGSPTIPGTNLYLRADPGLTALGRTVLHEMARVGMILDLAHASPRLFDDALAVWSGPVVVSHTATAALYSSPRNLTDDQLRAIAARDGVVGILVQRQFLGGDHLANVADHIAHAVEVVGADHVGLGLDMEEVTTGVLPAEFRDIRDLPKLTELLLRRGLPERDVEKVLGFSVLNFLTHALGAAPSD